MESPLTCSIDNFYRKMCPILYKYAKVRWSPTSTEFHIFFCIFPILKFCRRQGNKKTKVSQFCQCSCQNRQFDHNKTFNYINIKLLIIIAIIAYPRRGFVDRHHILIHLNILRTEVRYIVPY